MFAASVIICSHNPREDYLRRVLDALKAQALPAKDWELLLVDNASKEPLAKRVDLSWHPHARHICEDKVGLTHARLRGIAESKSDLLVFVDDDNVLRADYLQAALKISKDWPQLGAWGGSCLPEFEAEPCPEMRPWLAGLLIEKLSTQVWARLRSFTEALPPGAGMTVRGAVAKRYRELVLRDPVRQALGRTGKKLAAGEDSDMALCGFEVGLGTGRFPELELTHLIPARRVTLEYIEGLHEGFGYSDVVLKAIHHREALAQLQSGGLKNFLLPIVMTATGKSRVQKRIRLAEERGRTTALRDLEASGYFNQPPRT